MLVLSLALLGPGIFLPVLSIRGVLTKEELQTQAWPLAVPDAGERRGAASPSRPEHTRVARVQSTFWNRKSRWPTGASWTRPTST